MAQARAHHQAQRDLAEPLREVARRLDANTVLAGRRPGVQTDHLVTDARALVHPDLGLCEATLAYVLCVPLRALGVNHRLAGIDDCTGHRQSGVLFVPVHLLGTDEHKVCGVVEVVGLNRIFGQVLDQVQFEPEQVVHRVLVLDVCQPTGRGLGSLLARVRDVISHARFDPRRDLLPLGVGWLRLVLRRHLAVLQYIQNRLPAFQLLTRRQIAVERMDCDLALAFHRAMAPDAVLFKKRRNNVLVPRDITSGRLGFHGLQHCRAIYWNRCLPVQRPDEKSRHEQQTDQYTQVLCVFPFQLHHIRPLNTPTCRSRHILTIPCLD